jgi:Icc-related predicted phosphoesterase
MRVAAVADLHCTVEQRGYWAPRLESVNSAADALLLAGDLTASGDMRELAVLLDELSIVKVPIVAVLGNHDYDGGRAYLLGETLRRAGIQHLEGAGADLGELVVAGGMGVEGGFHKRRRWDYAERQFMARLEHYLSRAGTARRIALLHYAPITATLRGEPEDLYELLGSSAMEAAIDAVGADLVLHGHAHNGVQEGHTAGGVPVYNVALPVLERAGLETPYRVFEL